MIRSLSLSLALSSTLILAACEDPAEGVAPATVSPATAPATTETAGTVAAGGRTASAAATARETLAIDRATSSVGFTGSKVTGSHDGTFGEFDGSIDLDPASVTASSVRVTIQVASLAIEPERLATHLRTGDFFQVDQFPTATFESTSITAGATGNVGDRPATHTVAGNLTMRGQTRAISFPAIVTVGDDAVTAQSEFSINRQDFGIAYAGMPDDLIRNDVIIRFSVRAPRAAS